MRFAIPLWVPDLLIKADVKTAKVSVSLGAWSGMPIIAIGPKGGKIVGYGVGGKKIYANTSQAQALAAHLKVQHETDQKKQVAQVLDWLKALGISAQEAGGHDIAVSHAVGEMLTQHFHVKPVQNLATFQVFPLAALLPYRGKPFHPPEDEHTGWAAAVASGDDEATVFPDLSTLQEVSAGSFAGSHGNKLFKTPTGKKWVFKSENPTIARAEEASARIQRLIIGDRVPAVKYVEVNGKAGALIQVISGTPLNENHSSSASLSQMKKYTQQIAASFVADWLTANHDGHSGNFLADGPLLNAIDKGQSWRFFGKDKLEPGYHPNPSPTVYNKFWSAFEDGSLDPELVLAGLSAAVIRAEKITLDQFKLIAAPYVATAAPFGGFDAGQRLNEMASRLAMLRKDIESFATGVFQKPVQLAQEPGADNFETMPEAESKDAEAPKLIIQNPDQPQVIEGGAKQPVVTTATPGWPVTKGDTTIHSPGTPPPAGVKWPGGVPGPGFVLATKYKGKDYQLAIQDGSKGLGPLFEVKYPDGSIATYDSMNKAGDSLYLFANGLPLTMSATEKKAKKIGLGSKAFKLGAFKSELAAAHSAPESTAAMAPAELEAAGVVAKGAETLSPWQALAATKNGTVLTDHSVLPANVQAAAKVAAKGEKQYVGGFAPGSVTWGIVTNGPLAGQKYLLVAQGASHYELFSESGSVAVWSAKHVQEYFGIGLADEPTLIPTPIPSPGPPPKAVLPAEGVKAKGALNVTGGPLAAGTVIEKIIFIGPEASEGTHKLVVKDDGTFEVSHSFSDPTDGHPVVQTSEHKTLAHAAAFAHHVQVHGDWPDDALPSYKKLLASIDGWKYWGITPVAEAPAQPQESPAYKVTSSQALLDDFKPGAKIVFTVGDGMIYTAIRVSGDGGEWKWHTDLNPGLDTELPADKLFDLLSEPEAKIVEMQKDAANILDLMDAAPDTPDEATKPPSDAPWSVNENGGYPLWEDMKPGIPQKFSPESPQTGMPEPTSFLYHAPIGSSILAGDGVAYQKGGSGSWHSSENDLHLKGAWLAKQIAATSLSGWSAWKPAHEAIDPYPAAWAEGKVGTSLTALKLSPSKEFLTEAPPGTSMVAHTIKATVLAKKSPGGFWLIAHPESEQGQKGNEDLAEFLDSKLGDVWVQAPLPGSVPAAPPPVAKTKQPSVPKNVKIVYAADIASAPQSELAGKVLSKLIEWKNDHPSLVQKPSNWDSWVPPPGVIVEGKHEGQTYYLVTTTTGANQGDHEPGEKVAFAIIAPDGSLHEGAASESSVSALKKAGKAAGIPGLAKDLKAVFGLTGVEFAAGESHWSLHGLEELPIAPNMLGDTAPPQPKAPAKVTPAPMDPAKAALIEKAKAVAAWAKDHPVPTAVESLNVLAHFQNHAKQQHPKLELWARTTDGALLLGSAHEGFSGMMASLGIAGKEVETPLGTFYELTTAELAAATPGQPAMGMTEGPDGKTYPKGTTFTTSEVPHTVESLLKSEPGFYKITAHKTDAESAVLKVSGSGEEQKKQIEAMLQKYSIPTTGTVAGSSNVLAFVKKADLAKVWKTETIVSPTIPPQPPAFTQAALPVGSTSEMWAEMKSHPATELALIPSTKIGRFGKVIVMGTPGVLRDFQVSVRKVKDKNGNFFHEVSGQLANFNEKNSSLNPDTVGMPTGSAQPDADGKFTLNYSEEGGYTDESGPGAGPLRSAAGRIGSTDSGSAIEVETSDNPTFGGFFRVRIPDGADLESELKHAFTKMGYDGDAVVAPLSEGSERVFKKWSIVRSLLGPTGWNKALTAKTMIHKESWLDKLLAEHKGAHLVEQATIRQTFDGHVSVVLQDGEKFTEEGWTCATRQDKNLDSLFFQIAQGVGWSSRKTKYVMGSVTSGWSPGQDIANGGATGAYFRVRKGTPQFSGGGYEIIAHPRVFSRTDWWRYSSDSYGSIGDASTTSGGMKRYDTGSGTSGNNEIMFAGGVSLADIMAVTVSHEFDKTTLISRLNAVGITQVNGVDLSDFILAGSHDVLNRIHPALKA